MIYSVVPEELADELYDRLVEYYRDDPNVKVIVDRRKSERRRAAAAEGEGPAQRETPDRSRRPRAGPAPGAARACLAIPRRWTHPAASDPRDADVKVVVHVDGGARGN